MDHQVSQSQLVLQDAYGCKCNSEKVIFCFDKRTGKCTWSCSGHCFEPVPSETVATQTDNYNQSFPALQNKSTSSYRTKATETEIHGVDRSQELMSVLTDALDVCSQERERHTVTHSISCDVIQGTSSTDEAIRCLSDANDVDLEPIPITEKPECFKDASLYDGNNRVAGDGDHDDSDGDGTFVDIIVADDDDDEHDNDYNAVDYDASRDIYVEDDENGDDDDDNDGGGGGEEDDDVDNEDDGVNDGGNGDDDDDDSDYDGGDDNGIDGDGDNVMIEAVGDTDSRFPEDISVSPPTKIKQTRTSSEKIRSTRKGGTPREVFPCSYCTRKCTTKSIYEKHIEWHTRSKETKCNICGKEFSKPGYLVNHGQKHQQAREQGKETNKATSVSECRHCGKLVKKGRLIGHERTHTHSRQKRTMVCSYCGKTFTSPSEFDRHVRTHTKEKPYKCTQCESAFYSNKELTIHIRRHLGDKRYKCDYCSKAFVRKCNRDDHLRTHTGARPFKCEYCDKSFGFRNVLKVHLVQHTGVRPHVCEYCSKGFAKKAFLKKHLRNHTGEQS